MKTEDLREYVSKRVWLIPVAMLLASVLSAFATSLLDKRLEDSGVHLGAWVTWSPEAARAILSTVASSMLTITAVVFSITILVLQLASTQFSPRALRTFLRDTPSKLTLGVLIGTFSYSLTAMSFVRGVDGEQFVPRLTMIFVFVAVFVSLLTLVYFIDHVATKIQVSSIIKSIGDETISAMDRNWPARSDDVLSVQSEPAPEMPHQLRSVHTGVIVSVDVSTIVEIATEHNAVVRLKAKVGDFIPSDTEMLETSKELDERTASRILKSVKQATQRNLEQDIAFGFRELTDIALRALSPAMNDPTTAINVVDAERDLLRKVGKRLDEDGGYGDEAGALRFVMEKTTWTDYLRMLFDEVGSAGEGFPRVRSRLKAAATDLMGYLPQDRARDVRSVAKRWLDDQGP